MVPSAWFSRAQLLVSVQRRWRIPQLGVLSAHPPNTPVQRTARDRHFQRAGAVAVLLGEQEPRPPLTGSPLGGSQFGKEFRSNVAVVCLGSRTRCRTERVSRMWMNARCAGVVPCRVFNPGACEGRCHFSVRLATLFNPEAYERSLCGCGTVSVVQPNAVARRFSAVAYAAFARPGVSAQHARQRTPLRVERDDFSYAVSATLSRRSIRRRR